MNTISFVSDDTGKNHTIKFDASQLTKRKLIKQFDKSKNNLQIVDEFIEQFNADNDGIIKEYNYEIVNDTEFNAVILFKHMFRNFKESQKYTKVNVKRNNESLRITYDKRIKLDLEIPSKAELLPISSVSIDAVDENDICHITIQFVTLDTKDSYPNFIMAKSLIEMNMANMLAKQI
jgi:hypothetical protein